MRPARAARAAVLLLSAASLCCTASASAEQHVLSNKGPTAPQPPNTTIVDVLAQDEDYSLLVYLLQRARLIPTLNRLNGSTVFAPTNDAIKNAAGRDSLSESSCIAQDECIWNWALVDSPPPDNVQATLRANLLYHMLNYTLPFPSSEAPVAPSPAFFETLLVPSPEQGRGRPGDPPDNGEVSDGLLGDREGQKLRVARREDDKATFVGVDFEGRGGAKVVKPDKVARNGVVLGIGEVLKRPPSLGESLFVFMWTISGWLITRRYRGSHSDQGTSRLVWPAESVTNANAGRPRRPASCDSVHAT
jgi:solute carrier family 25 carnitine/acylcarnitine transporter 20/29